MGVWDRLQQEKEQKENRESQVQEKHKSPVADTMVSLLFDRVYAQTAELETMLREGFGAEAHIQVDNSHKTATHFILQMQGLEFWCSYMPFLLPKAEANIPELLKYNRGLSVEEENTLKGQRSFFLIVQKGGGKALKQKREVCLLISRLCGVLMKAEGAIGFLYNHAGILLSKKQYLKHMAVMKREKENANYFPVMLWVLIYSSRARDGELTIETCGLEPFGFSELQFYDPKAEWAKSCERLYFMSLMQITGQEHYKDMDVVSFERDSFSVCRQYGETITVMGNI